MSSYQKTYRVVLILAFVAVGSLRLPCLAPWIASSEATHHSCSGAAEVKTSKADCCAPAYLGDSLALVAPNPPAFALGPTKYEPLLLIWPEPQLNLNPSNFKPSQPRAPPVA